MPLGSLAFVEGPGFVPPFCNIFVDISRRSTRVLHKIKKKKEKGGYDEAQEVEWALTN